MTVEPQHRQPSDEGEPPWVPPATHDVAIDINLNELGGGVNDGLCGVFCGMCLDHVPATDVVRSCNKGHQWCRRCLRGYLASQVRDAQLTIPCPSIDDAGRCSESIDEAVILPVLDLDTAAKYRRFQLLSNPNMRECPRKRADGTLCLHLQEGSDRNPAMTCTVCNGEYCWAHANAHPGETCKSYVKRQKTVVKANDRYIKQIAKACPSCKAPTQKANGCIHMTCSQCRTHWCWVCGVKTCGGGDEHFSPLSPFGCGTAEVFGGADFVSNNYTRTVLNFMGLSAARLAITPYYLFAFVTAIPTLLLLMILCLPSICRPYFNKHTHQGRKDDNFYGWLWLSVFSARSEENHDRIPFSAVLFIGGYWPMVFLGLGTMIAFSPLLIMCCCWRRNWWRNADDRLLQLLSCFSLWPCLLSIILLFIMLCVGLAPLHLIYALWVAPRAEAKLDLEPQAPSAEAQQQQIETQVQQMEQMQQQHQQAASRRELHLEDALPDLG